LLLREIQSLDVLGFRIGKSRTDIVTCAPSIGICGNLLSSCISPFTLLSILRKLFTFSRHIVHIQLVPERLFSLSGSDQYFITEACFITHRNMFSYRSLSENLYGAKCHYISLWSCGNRTIITIWHLFRSR